MEGPLQTAFLEGDFEELSQFVVRLAALRGSALLRTDTEDLHPPPPHYTGYVN